MLTKAVRQKAGERYAAALAELRDAYIDLYGIDLAMQGLPDLRTFRGDFDVIPWELRHPEFASDPRPGILIEVRARLDRATRHGQ